MSWDPCDWCKTVTGVDPREEINKLENTYDAAKAAVGQAYDKAKTEVADDYNKAKAAVGNAYDKGKAAVGAEIKKAESALGIGGSKGGAGGLSLGGSVGRGGKNNPEEVKAVQRALGIQDDGKCGPGTIKAIEDFQRSIGQAKPDGRVDPGGATARALASGAKPAPGLVDRLIDDVKDEINKPPSGQPDASGDLDARYRDCLAKGNKENYELAAEFLNGFNRDDIISRLQGLSRDQIDSLHQGALGNPRVGPQANVAQLTGTITVTITIAPGGVVIVPPTPGLPDPFDPKIIDPDVFKFPKIPAERPPTGPVGPTPGPLAGGGAATTTAAGGVGVGVTVTVFAAGFIVGFVSPFLIGYVIERAAELRERPDPDELSLPGGVSLPPMQEGDAGAPAVDPNTGVPLGAPGLNTDPADAPGTSETEPLQFTPDKLPPTAQEFFDKVRKSKTPVVFRNLPLDVIDVLKAKYGCDLAAGLQQQGTIASYEGWQRVVAGCGGNFHAHHIVEEQVLKRLGYPVDQCPAVILTAEEHIAVHKMINSLRPGPIDDSTRKQILKGYEAAYKNHPYWMPEVRRYLK